MTPQNISASEPSVVTAVGSEVVVVPQGRDPAGFGPDRLVEALTALSQLQAENENLRIALRTNREIAAAVGILMARLQLTLDQAFDRLRSSSQRCHRKLHDIASEVLFTGALPDD